MENEDLLADYFEEWIRTWKEGAVRDVTLRKYEMSLKNLREIAPKLKLKDLDRNTYQKIINAYAKNHEKATCMDFHHQLKACVLDAVDDGLVEKDPTRRAVIKGKKPAKKKPKFLNQYEVHALIQDLDLGEQVNFDYLIYLIIKTGMRFAEALAITPDDFELRTQSLNITKTWDYKNGGGFMPTKNKSSVRKIRIDWETASKFGFLCKNLPPDEPIFVKKGTKVYNSTVNDLLEKHCKNIGAEPISVHGLRHTHASLLLYAGASVASVSKRLGHSNMATTQKVYLHIIQELENQDVDLMMRSLSAL